MTEKLDEELQAIATVLGALEPLKPDARSNVIDYVFRRLGIVSATPDSPSPPGLNAGKTSSPAILPTTSPSGAKLVDLRTLTQQKNPQSANQMVALVAYYLAHHAPQDERRDYIVPDDIQKYFIQAGFPLPNQPRMTLTNAKNAGYLDAIKDGQYRLNPVGHNLVAHKLAPSENNSTNRIGRHARKKKAKSAGNKRRR
jgi:hypothetical protein